MSKTKKEADRITRAIIGAAIEVNKELGPGLLESIYQECMNRELASKGLTFVPQMSIPVNYKGKSLSQKYICDILVEDLIVVELKASKSILPVHEAQLLTYMRLLQKPKGVVINFNVTNIFKYGQKTRINKYWNDLPDKN